MATGLQDTWINLILQLCFKLAGKMIVVSICFLRVLILATLGFKGKPTFRELWRKETRTRESKRKESSPRRWVRWWARRRRRRWSTRARRLSGPPASVKSGRVVRRRRIRMTTLTRKRRTSLHLPTLPVCWGCENWTPHFIVMYIFIYSSYGNIVEIHSLECMF